MLPRVSTILKAVGPELDNGYLQPKHLRRGRLVETIVTLAAQGKEIEPEWWLGSSGERDDDLVEHEECRPYYNMGLKFLREKPMKLRAYQLEVIHLRLGYCGHLDWEVAFEDQVQPAIVDVKCGAPPTPNSPYDRYCRLQLQLYHLANLSHRKRTAKLYNLHLWPDNYRLIERNNLQDRHQAEIIAQYFNVRQQWQQFHK